jgi:hypothetical protein
MKTTNVNTFMNEYQLFAVVCKTPPLALQVEPVGVTTEVNDE